MILKRFNVEQEVKDPDEAEKLQREGWEILELGEKAEEAPYEAEQEETCDYAAMTKAELVKKAAARGIAGAKALTKQQLVEVLEKEAERC